MINKTLIPKGFTYRDRNTITLEILSTMKQNPLGIKKTIIMLKCNLNYKQLLRYINFLTTREFVVEENNSYKITDKGKEFLSINTNMILLQFHNRNK